MFSSACHQLVLMGAEGYLPWISLDYQGKCRNRNREKQAERIALVELHYGIRACANGFPGVCVAVCSCAFGLKAPAAAVVVILSLNAGVSLQRETLLGLQTA